MAKVAVVTGGASGIGEACCHTFARDGFVVAVADINEAGAKKVADALTGSGHRAIQADMANEQSVIDLFDTVEAEMGPVTVLACVAGRSFVEQGVKPSIVNMKVSTWMETEALNSRGTFLCVREYLRKREKTPVEDGRIILTASTAAYQGTSPTGPAYAASKGAVVAFTRVAAIEAAPLKITVNAVAPGTILTPAVLGDLTPDQIAMAAKNTPLGRNAEAGEMAEIFSFLASPKSGFMTGSILHSNGGKLMV